ncbi:hypothetical protein Y032_1194g3744 [Ancylostoma ceylanicum]|nr:hypothetical protein Y032_1194g3744 [Ancylostoma ceylanicum]
MAMLLFVCYKLWLLARIVSVHGTPSIGQQVCQPFFSEISTLYLGTNKQGTVETFDEFLEIGYSPEVCKDHRHAKLHDYNIAVIDTRPRSSTAAASLLYASLYHRKMPKDKWFFVVGRKSAVLSRSAQFDLPYTESMVSAEINGIMGAHLEGRSQYVQQLSNEEMSHYPVIFVIYRKPESAKDVKSMSNANEALSYFVRAGSRKLVRKTDVNLLSKLDVIEPIFRYAADVVVVNRNSTMTKNSNFLKKMFEILAEYGVRAGMVAVSVDHITRDLPTGFSISMCIPQDVEQEYRRTHTSQFWKTSTHSPGESNDCSLSDLIRFDETNGYAMELATFQYRPHVAEDEADVDQEVRQGNDFNNANDVAQGVPTLSGITVPPANPPASGAGETADEQECTAVEGVFSLDDFKALSSKVDYLYTQAIAKEGQQHKEALDNARAAMEQYEESVRKNFIARDADMILDSGFMESDAVRAEVAKLTCSDFKYMRPLFGDEWSNGRRKVNIRCEPCYEAYLASKKKDAPALATAKGTELNANIVKTLRNHMRNTKVTHQKAVLDYDLRTKKRVNDYLASVDTRINDPTAATARLFFLTYTAVKMYLPPFQFPTLCDAAAALGMEIGNKHRTRKAYVSMANMISSTMEERMVSHLKASQTPFSLLLDTTTDHSGKKILLAYVRFPCKVTLFPTTHFMKAFEMKEAETGENLFLKLYSFFHELNLVRELTWNLVAVATDGASNMVANRGLQGYLNANVSSARVRDLTRAHASAASISAVSEKPIIWIHCMAHKIELALSDALMDYDDTGRRVQSQFHKWRSFTTKFLNQLRNFFGPMSSSRKRVLTGTLLVLEDQPFLQLKQVIDVRWASSERESISNFLRIYKQLWLALLQITQLESEFDHQTRLRAAGFLYVLKSLKFYRYVVYQMQLMDMIGKLSKAAQVTSSTTWEAAAQLEAMTQEMSNSAESPNQHEGTRPFIELVLCSEAIGSGSFKANAFSNDKCAQW